MVVVVVGALARPSGSWTLACQMVGLSICHGRYQEPHIIAPLDSIGSRLKFVVMTADPAGGRCHPSTPLPAA